VQGRRIEWIVNVEDVLGDPTLCVERKGTGNSNNQTVPGLNDVAATARANHARQQAVHRHHHIPSAYQDDKCEHYTSSKDICAETGGAIAPLVRTFLVSDKQEHGDCATGAGQSRDYDNSTRLHGAFSDNVVACVKAKEE
jgi:hypothetical protein